MRKRMFQLCLVGLTLAATAILAAGDEPGKKPDSDKKDTAAGRGPATVQPARQVHVNPKTSGQVTEILVDVGDKVLAGQVLARLDRAEYELKVRRADVGVARSRALLNEAEAKLVGAEEEIKQAEAAIKLAEAQREYAKRKLERLRQLADAKAISEELLR